MYTALGAAELKQATRSTELYGLNDRDLIDIGITRGEIDYFASNRGIDPQGIRQMIV